MTGSEDRFLECRENEWYTQEEAKEDLFAVFECAPNQVTGLLEEVNAGNIDGLSYTGERCCLIGTLARLKKGKVIVHGNGRDPQEVRMEIDSLVRTRNPYSPAERLFTNIRSNNIPRSQVISSKIVEWTLEWLESHGRLK